MSLAKPPSADVCAAFARHVYPTAVAINALLLEQLSGTNSAHDGTLTIPQRWVQWFSSPVTLVPARVNELSAFVASREGRHDRHTASRPSATVARAGAGKPFTVEAVGRLHEEKTTIALKGSDGKMYTATSAESDVVVGPVAIKVEYQSTTMKQLPSVASIQSDLLAKMRAIDAPV